MNETKQKLQAAAPGILGGAPFFSPNLYGSYVKALVHPFSDLDIGIFVEDMDIDACLELELSLALPFHEQLNHSVSSEVRILHRHSERIPRGLPRGGFNSTRTAMRFSSKQ